MVHGGVVTPYLYIRHTVLVYSSLPACIFITPYLYILMQSPYLYILMRSPYFTYSNKMEYNMVVYYIQSPNTKRKTRKRKKTNQILKEKQEKEKNIFSAAAEKWQKCCRGRGGIHPGCCKQPGQMVLARGQPALPTWTPHSSRFLIQPGRMGRGIRPGCPVPVGQPGQMAP